MSISITTSNEIFENKQNLIIIFSAFSGEIESITKENYVFIYGNNELVGINIFNYKEDFKDISEGYHSFSDLNFNKISKKFPTEMKNVKNNSFFKTGLIENIENHPKSEKLKILSVKINNETLPIVTNLDNLKPGDYHLFATNKAFLATGMVITESKVMGSESKGMICSYKSLGIDKEGIIKIDNKNKLEEYTF